LKPHRRSRGNRTCATGIFFQSYGTVLGILAVREIAFTVVQPVVWKRALKVPAGEHAARPKASPLLPVVASYWRRSKVDGPGLIALYGARHRGNV